MSKKNKKVIEVTEHLFRRAFFDLNSSCVESKAHRGEITFLTSHSELLKKLG